MNAGKYMRHTTYQQVSCIKYLYDHESCTITMNLKIPAVCWLYLVALTLIQELPTATSTEQFGSQSDHQVVFPGSQSSCKDIHKKYLEYRSILGHYWMDDYCGMEYSGVSCEDIHVKYPRKISKNT